MRLGRASWILSMAAVASIAISAPFAYAKDTPETVQVGSFSGAFLAARVAEVDNDLDTAIAYYKRALAFNPNDVQLKQSVLLALIAQGRFDESLPYAEMLKTVPDVERFSRVALGVDAIRKKDYPAAETWLKLALQSDLDRLITGVMSGWVKLGADQKTQAIEAVEKLEGPEWFGLFRSYHAALIADAAGLNDKADQSYRAFMDNVAAGGSAPETWMRGAEAYARFLARQGKKDEALAILDRADEFSTGRPPIAALREQIRKGETIAPLVATPADGSAEILLNLATALNRGGGEPFVRLYLQYALALKPDSDETLMQLAGVAEQFKDGQAAIDLYRRVPEASPLKRMADLQLGLNLADLDQYPEAVEHLKKLVAQTPDDMRGYLALGGVYSSKEDYRDAADLYDKAVATLTTPSRATWNIFYQRGIAYERLKEWDKAEPNFRKALELFPDQPQVMNYLGYSWVDMHMNLEEGLDLIKRAVELRPSDGYIVDSLGWAYYRMGRYEEAVKELERAVSLMPNDPVLNDHLGDAYWRTDRKLEATFQWSHARDLKPEPDILAQVQKKLSEGLPPADKAEAEKPAEPAKVEAQPVPATPAEQTEKRTEAPPAPATIEKTEAAVPTEAEVVPAVYTVQPGQSLWSIADRILGNGERYREILRLNPQLRGDPARLHPGQELTLPAAQ